MREQGSSVHVMPAEVLCVCSMGHRGAGTHVHMHVQGEEVCACNGCLGTQLQLKACNTFPCLNDTADIFSGGPWLPSPKGTPPSPVQNITG